MTQPRKAAPQTAYSIRFLRGGELAKSVAATPGENLFGLAQAAGVAIDAPCAGNGSCGKCRLLLLEGEVAHDYSPALAADDFALGWRLACRSHVCGDASFELPDSAEAWQAGLKAQRGAADEQSWQALKASLIAHQFWQLDVGAAGEKVVEADGADPPAAGAGAAGAAAPAPAGGGAAAAAPAGAPAALAFDLGTTGVSALLLDMSNGEVLASASLGNAQIRYGADVISRIIQQSRPGGVERLRRAVLQDTLNPLIATLLSTAGLSGECVRQIAIAGNTTMNHLLLGLPTESIRMEPFAPCFLKPPNLTAADVGLELAGVQRPAPGSSAGKPSCAPPQPTLASQRPTPEARIPVFLAPNVGGYVGGDITAGVLASGIWESDELQLFIDLGTNGELVFGNRELMLTCACSAGPAFEGGEISNGMRATQGAIEAVRLNDDLEPEFTVIGGGRPLGICGSGLIDLVAELWRTGAIDGRGRLNAISRRVRRDEYGIGSYVLAFAGQTPDHGGPAPTSDIVLSEVDISSFIRAKAAIFSAIMVMLSSTGFSLADISRVLVAGGIGSGINMANAVAIGLFPKLSAKRLTYI
ncbi:MAG: ASKHA domain-containing protein, partial [Coriobacteriales bacterium]|nr:ASKHA domain-containing protein [Coriobacteriales bacterium]